MMRPCKVKCAGGSGYFNLAGIVLCKISANAFMAFLHNNVSAAQLQVCIQVWTVKVNVQRTGLSKKHFGRLLWMLKVIATVGVDPNMCYGEKA
jgi:hypothetical protein